VIRETTSAGRYGQSAWRRPTLDGLGGSVERPADSPNGFCDEIRTGAEVQAGEAGELSRYPEFECTFTHGLLREAVLSTLTAARKRALYARIAAAFESLYADFLEAHSERLAHYHAQAGNLPKALEYAGRVRGDSS
jgi:hypothetical protein